MVEFLKQHVLSLVFGVIAVGLAVLTVERLGEQESGRPQGGGRATPVVVAEVIAAPFLDTLQAVGTAAAFESVEITANVADRIATIRFREGDLVRAGDVLVEMDTTEEQAALAEAEANLEDMRTQYRRLQELVATNAAALSARDEQKARMDGAAARVDVIRARIADRTIQAPFTGLIGLRQVSPGALVAPGARITTLDTIEPMKLDFSVPENFLPSVQRGAAIRARTVAFPDRTFAGEVAYVSPRVDPVTRALAVRAELPNAERLLRPGMLMMVDLVQDRRQGLMLPESALIPQGQRQYVYRVSGEGDALAAERVEVTIGARAPGIVEITGGLEAGDLVVVEGGIRLRPGASVSIQREMDTTGLVPDWQEAAGAADVTEEVGE